MFLQTHSVLTLLISETTMVLHKLAETLLTGENPHPNLLFCLKSVSFYSPSCIINNAAWGELPEEFQFIIIFVSLISPIDLFCYRYSLFRNWHYTGCSCIEQIIRQFSFNADDLKHGKKESDQFKVFI